ncbi:uncharacterized protein LOC141644537 [Silene latifolia]|uniref:uncharacterized protein LOC141644537 n=1 Tax=Silene latifolia TaxID=37657 RepID=UPI003D76DD62
MPVLPRIKVFFWQLCHDCLATKVNIAKRLTGHDMDCPFCYNNMETCLHMFRDCGWVEGFWEGLGLQVSVEGGGERVREWVETTLKEMWEKSCVEFMVGCWALWERRNKFIFEGVRGELNGVNTRVRGLLGEMRADDKRELYSCAGNGSKAKTGDWRGVEEQGEDGNKRGEEQGWAKPREGVVKVNIDAGFMEGMGMGFGVVCRDEHGVVTRVVAVQMEGTWDVKMAEAHAVLVGGEGSH